MKDQPLLRISEMLQSNSHLCLRMSWLWRRRARRDCSFCSYRVTAELLPGGQGIIQPADVWTSVHQDLASTSLQPHPCQSSSPGVCCNKVVQSNTRVAPFPKTARKELRKERSHLAPGELWQLTSGPSLDVGQFKQRTCSSTVNPVL